MSKERYYADSHVRKIRKQSLPGLSLQVVDSDSLEFRDRILLLLERGDLDESKVLLERALRIYPDNVTLLSQNGVVHYYQGELKEAIDLWESAIQIVEGSDISKQERDENVKILTGQIGNALIRIKDYDTAEKCYRKCLLIDPIYYPALSDLGDILSNKGKYKEALELFNRSIELAPDMPGGYYSKGNCLRDMGALEEAAKMFSKAISVDPEHRSSFINLGNIQMGNGEFGDAMKNYDAALALDPCYLDTILCKALCLIKSDKKAEAKFFLQAKLRSVLTYEAKAEIVSMLEQIDREESLCARICFWLSKNKGWVIKAAVGAVIGGIVGLLFAALG